MDSFDIWDSAREASRLDPAASRGRVPLWRDRGYPRADSRGYTV